ncbi:general stress protein [Isoptericola sp. BMS4]|uniref:general stress protein n=1 Tax=Isoptericola sp. BMS4 TaxID=2527875 RepID=UPI00141DA225|nr:ECF transporter S component [Isoptericola sp. BMS4]
MSFSQKAVPRVPTLPGGDEVAAYDTYLEAQQAVDYLSDNKFPVEHVTIVGTDLRMVERVTGRLSYGRVALAGALSGAWFGFFVGLLLSLFGGTGATSVIFVGIALGAGFGLMFSVLSYAFTGGRRDFTSSSQIVASSYAILCAAEQAGDARAMLMESPSGLGKARRGSTTRQAAPATTTAAPGAEAPPAPRTPDPRWTTPSGQPRYGAMRPDQPQSPAQAAPPQQTTTPDQAQQPAQPQAPAQPEQTQQPEPQQPAPPQSQPEEPRDPYAPPSDDDRRA